MKRPFFIAKALKAYLDHIVTIATPIEGDLITNLECSTFGFGASVCCYVTFLLPLNLEKYHYWVLPQHTSSAAWGRTSIRMDGFPALFRAKSKSSFS